MVVAYVETIILLLLVKVIARGLTLKSSFVMNVANYAGFNVTNIDQDINGLFIADEALN